ncbi:MAG: glycosyltransferase family 4 protein [Desulfuromonadales bacterium]
MKVLVLDEWFPWPLESGKKIRTCNLMRQLAREFEILYLAYADVAREQEKIAAMESFGIRPLPVPDQRLPKWSGRFYAAVLKNFLSPEPFSTDYHIQPNYIAALQYILAAEKPDLVHCEWSNLAPFLVHAAGVPQVIAAHNIESDIWRRLGESGGHPAKRYLGRSQARKIERLERHWYPRADHCIAVSAGDRQVMEDYGARVSLVENGVDLDYYQMAPAQTVEPVVSFTASMDTFSNQDGADYLVREIWPRIKKARPGVRLWLIGKDPPERLRALAKQDAGIRVTGTVPDVRDYVGQSTVCLVPLRIGGGSRLKILEAMAMGKAVVSTAIGAEGLEYTAGRDILIADAPAAFADAAIACLDDIDLRRRLGAAGRALVAARYDWRPLATKQAALWRQVAGGEAPTNMAAGEGS